VERKLWILSLRCCVSLRDLRTCNKQTFEVILDQQFFFTIQKSQG
jgi:hypothetical protein